MGRDTELITLIKSGTPEGVKKYLAKLRKSGSAKKISTINYQNEEGLSALHLCSMQNQLDLLNDLLELKASVDLKDNRGLTPLHYAAFRGNLEAAHALLEFNASPCSVANSKETPLHVAAQYGHSNVMSVLVDFQANPLIYNESKQTPLDVACFMGHTKAVRVLLDTGCFPSRYAHGQSLIQSPIHMCAKQGHTEILKMLVECGYSVDEMGPNGTPLHEAALYGRVDVVKLLVQLGCNQNLRNSQNQTAMDLVHKFTNPRAYTSRQILQALSQARPVAIPRPPSTSQSSATLNFPPSPSHSSHSVNSLPDNAHIPETDSQDTPVRGISLNGMQTEPEPELVMSPLPTHNEYEGAADISNFASMIAQAAVVRKNTLGTSRKVSNHQHCPSDPVDRLACFKSSKRESFSNSSTDTSFSTISNSGFSTGLSTPDRYQSPSPANLHSTQHSRPTYHTDYPSNDAYDVPEDFQISHPVSMATNLSLGHDLYDTPSPNSKPVDNYPDPDPAYQGERGPPVYRPARQKPADLVRKQPESSVVLKKLSSLPAGFHDVSAPNNMPIYDNQALLQENESESQHRGPAFQPVAMETVPPRPMNKPKLAPKSAVPPAVASGEKEHLSELQKKLVMRKIASETALGTGGVNSQPPPPPTTAPPPMTSPMPPKKPPRDTQPAYKPPAPLPEERPTSPEGESEFLEALRAKKGSLKRSNTSMPWSPPPLDEEETPFRPPNPPRPFSGTMESADRVPSPDPLNDTHIPPLQQRSATIAVMNKRVSEGGIGTNTSPEGINDLSRLQKGPAMRSGTLVSKISSIESWPLEKFLSALKLTDYLAVLTDAGYSESADFVGISADEVTEAGVSKAGHKKKLFTSLQSLSAKHTGYQHIPTSIETWLVQWNLLSYQSTLIESGYDDLEFIADMTVEELMELGINKKPVLKRFSLALSHLHECIQSHRSMVLSGSAHTSPQVTPQKPNLTPQQPTKLKECDSNHIPSPHISNHYTHTNNNTENKQNDILPQKMPSADPKSPPPRPPEDSLTPTREVPPVTPTTPKQQLPKPSVPVVAKKPGVPPPVSRKPPVERRNSRPSHDSLPDYPSPQRVPDSQEFPSPLQLDTDFPPPPPAVGGSFFPDFQEDLPPPPMDMSLPLDSPPPPPPDTYLQFQSQDDKQRRLSGLADLDEILSSMSSDDVTSPAHLPSPPPPQQRPIRSSEVLNDIDQMLANLNLEIDNLMTDS